MVDDPVNPQHYDGRACADIGERLTANGYQVLKYTWRLGRKEAVPIELGKATWYANSECELLAKLAAVGMDIRTAPLVFDIPEPETFLYMRIKDQPELTKTVARLLWRGYNLSEMQVIHDMLADERDSHASS